MAHLECRSQIGYTKVELITPSRPSAYPEYGPYRFVETEAEFEEAILKTNSACSEGFWMKSEEYSVRFKETRVS